MILLLYLVFVLSDRVFVNEWIYAGRATLGKLDVDDRPAVKGVGVGNRLVIDELEGKHGAHVALRYTLHITDAGGVVVATKLLAARADPLVVLPSRDNTIRRVVKRFLTPYADDLAVDRVIRLLREIWHVLAAALQFIRRATFTLGFSKPATGADASGVHLPEVGLSDDLKFSVAKRTTAHASSVATFALVQLLDLHYRSFTVVGNDRVDVIGRPISLREGEINDCSEDCESNNLINQQLLEGLLRI